MKAKIIKNKRTTVISYNLFGDVASIKCQTHKQLFFISLKGANVHQIIADSTSPDKSSDPESEPVAP